MQLEGSLETFPLRELIEMAVYSSVSGTLELFADQPIGRILFRDGLPCFATAGGFVGNDAIGLLFERRDASFRFEREDIRVEPNVWSDPWDLIERGEQHGRIWGKLRTIIRSVDLVPVLSPNTVSGSVQLNDSAWRVMSGINGERSIAMIADDLAMPLLDTCVGVALLQRQHMVTLREPDPARPVADTALPAQPEADAAQSAGFFERFMARTLAQNEKISDPARELKLPELHRRFESDPNAVDQQGRYVSNTRIRPET
jgi:hypothetical protein